MRLMSWLSSSFQRNAHSHATSYEQKKWLSHNITCIAVQMNNFGKWTRQPLLKFDVKWNVDVLVFHENTTKCFVISGKWDDFCDKLTLLVQEMSAFRILDFGGQELIMAQGGSWSQNLCGRTVQSSAECHKSTATEALKNATAVQADITLPLVARDDISLTAHRTIQRCAVQLYLHDSMVFEARTTRKRRTLSFSWR